MIVSSAVKLKDNRVFVGSRHGDCYSNIKMLGLEKEVCRESIQGFITDGLVFLNRENGYYHAHENKQCKKQEFNPNYKAVGLQIKEEDWKPVLFSEDLWQ